MSAQETKAIGRRHMELLDQRDLDGTLKLYAPAALCHGFAPQALDLDGYKQAMSALLSAFPDSRFSTDAIIVEEDKVAIRHTLQGTHRGAFQGIPPTNKQVTVSAIGILRVAEDKIVETWLNADFLGMLQQLGVAP
jgi:steroid delta-isomerase-like uncharacterized protein